VCVCVCVLPHLFHFLPAATAASSNFLCPLNESNRIFLFLQKHSKQENTYMFDMFLVLLFRGKTCITPQTARVLRLPVADSHSPHPTAHHMHAGIMHNSSMRAHTCTRQDTLPFDTARYAPARWRLSSAVCLAGRLSGRRTQAAEESQLAQIQTRVATHKQALPG
jgi:hypothetical protein